MKADGVIKATLRAIGTAQREYRIWSGGDWLDDAPEYMATTAIARALHKLDKVSFVTLENNVRAAVEDASGRLVGKPNRRLNLAGRFDLVVWNTRAPRGLIEVKTTVGGYSQLRPDIEKLCTALSKAHDVRWGLVAYFSAFPDGPRKDARDRVVDQTDKIAHVAKENVDPSYRVARHSGNVRNADGGAWRAEVLEIRRAN